MMNVLKSEFRKILTVRSAYIVALIAFALVAALSVVNLLQFNPDNVIGPNAIEESLYAGISIAAQITAVFAIILMGHEYRHNLIFHTLTTTKTRLSILVSKMIAILSYALVVSAIAVALGYIASSISIGIIVDNPPTQSVAFMRMALVGLLYVSSFALIGLLLTLLFRSIVAPIVVLILTPGTIEPLLGLALDDYAKYLPFTSLQQLVIPGVEGSILRSTVTIGVYLVVGWAVGWYLFTTRDASKK